MGKKLNPSAWRKILVVNPFGIGDALFSLILAEQIHSALPQARIGFLCNERTEALIRMSPVIDERIVFHRDLFRRLWSANFKFFFAKMTQLLGQIRRARFDAMFDLSLGREFSFYGALLGIPVRVGLDYKHRGFFLTHKIALKGGYKDKPVVDYQLDLLGALGISFAREQGRVQLEISGRIQTAASELLNKNALSGTKALLAVVPGGGRSWGKNAVYKQWPAERFAQTLNQLAERRSFEVLLLGDSHEAPLLKAVASTLRMPSGTVSGEAFETAAALLQRSTLVIGNDGGLLHLANALGVKSVSIYGPVSERVYGPYGQDTPHVVLAASVGCRPCYSNFRFPPCRHQRQCLRELSVEHVVAAAEKLF